MPDYYVHPRLEMTLQMSEALVDVARELVRAAASHIPARRGRHRGATLRPGPGTPMWNALVQEVRPYLAKYGEKAKLARLLGVPQQRVHEFFLTGTSAPDAERTLLLLHWLAQRRAGIQLG